MTQQINLYDASLRPVRDLLTLPNVLVAMAAALVLLIGLAVLGMWRSGDELRNFKAAEAQLRQAQEQLTVFAIQQATRRQDPALQQKLDETRALIVARQDVLGRLQAGDFGDRQGFSRYLRGLASVAVDGLWLTGFEVMGNGQQLAIRGRMLSESALPRYVQALRSQPAFAGREFNALNVVRVADPVVAEGAASPVAGGRTSPAVVEFTLTGMPENPAEKAR